MTQNNEDTKICTACGGSCCKHLAGAYYPDDLMPLSVNSLVERFKTGQYAVDWWEGDPREDHDELGQAEFIRPAHKGTSRLRDPSWGGKCIHLTEKGCILSFDDRPQECREIIPCADGNCHLEMPKRGAAIAWLPYRRMIKGALSKIEDES